METLNERTEPRQRLNPFQSNAALGTMQSRLLKEDENSSQETLTAAGIENRWVILEKERTPEPFFLNGKVDAGQTITAFREETVAEPAHEQLHALQEQRLKSLKSLKRPVEFRYSDLTDVRFRILQKWEGVVTAVENDCLFARLKDLTSQNPDEEVELALEEVSPDDRHLVQVGASFYWSIGYLKQAHGQITRASDIRFRRIPAWTPEDISSAKKQAQTDAIFYNLDCGNAPA
jgi:hypothetical protein